MSEKGIAFSGAMVRAILDGRKTVTRRVIPNATGAYWDHRGWVPVVENGDVIGWKTVDGQHHSGFPTSRSPYHPGDVLYIREAWRGHRLMDHLPPVAIPEGWQDVWWEADGSARRALNGKAGRCRHARFMPKWAARGLRLEVVSVRVERVQEISEAEAIAEGIECAKPATEGVVLPSNDMLRTNGHGVVMPSAKAEFVLLWDSINAKRGFGWEVNPWVRAIEFRRVR